MLAGTAVTNTGNTTISGSLGVSPGTSVTGFPPGLVAGQTNVANTAAAQAQLDLTAAYLDAAGRTPSTLLAADIGSGAVPAVSSLSAGVYRTASTLTVTGSLTLNGDSNSVFIFQVASALIMATSSSIVLNGVSASNVFWQVTSSATLNTTTTFNGYILALTAITVSNQCNITGGLLARNANVTLINDVFNTPPVVCYLKGTPILTKYGYKNIEDIVLGDEVCIYGNIKDNNVINKLNGEKTEKVIFSGFFSRSNLTIESKPIVFKAGSLGENMPLSDTGVSPGHGIIVGNKSVRADTLINNDTIYQSDEYETATYYHIELENHSIINANGMMGESLLGCHEHFEPIQNFSELKLESSLNNNLIPSV